MKLKKLICGALLFIFLISIILAIFHAYEGNVFLVAEFVSSSINKKYLFTYDGGASCKNNQDPMVIKVCETIDEIKKNGLGEKNARSVHELGIFKNSFIGFINGDKKIRFYYSEDLAGSKLTKSAKEKKLFSIISIKAQNWRS